MYKLNTCSENCIMHHSKGVEKCVRIRRLADYAVAFLKFMNCKVILPPPPPNTTAHFAKSNQRRWAFLVSYRLI